jgi:hypothetical protein
VDVGDKSYIDLRTGSAYKTFPEWTKEMWTEYEKPNKKTLATVDAVTRVQMKENQLRKTVTLNLRGLSVTKNFDSNANPAVNRAISPGPQARALIWRPALDADSEEVIEKFKTIAEPAVDYLLSRSVVPQDWGHYEIQFLDVQETCDRMGFREKDLHRQADCVSGCRDGVSMGPLIPNTATRCSSYGSSASRSGYANAPA